jgi:Mg2+-importing ATPase
MTEPPAFWSAEIPTLLEGLKSTLQGLTQPEAERRLDGNRGMQRRRPSSALRLFLAQFKSPIILILIFSAGLSYSLNDRVDALIIVCIVLISSLLGFWQEHGADNAVQALLQLVQVKATCLRDGVSVAVDTDAVVPGDLVVLRAGDIVPADCRILECRDLFVNEASLTGETFPVEKDAAPLPPETPLAQRTNSLFLGTSVVTGTARVVAVVTGPRTEFGKISQTLTQRSRETEFERGIRQFGYLVMEVTLLLVLTIFAANVAFHRPVLDSFQFSLALAVGLTPQLLPAIISINLAHGAKRMAQAKVIVKRLAAIENFGSMEILCTDKTGTLTEGVVRVHAMSDIDGNDSPRVLRFAALNAALQAGYSNPIDTAIVAYHTLDLCAYTRIDEIPYDFSRKRLSVVVTDTAGSHLLVTKGALSNVLDACHFVEDASGETRSLDPFRSQIQARYEALSREGYRCLGVAIRTLDGAQVLGKQDEAQMTFLGFVTLFDPLQEGIADALQELRGLGVSLKLITGDNALVAATISRQAGIPGPTLLTGTDLRTMSPEALVRRAPTVDVFAEVEPSQKEQVILALKRAGHVVGYMGDGINDASALHAADIGISVADAVDVAKEAAEIVLLEKDLRVLAHGVREGRVTFANTLKYIFMATSANFGNMFSMAGASLFLPFLPLLPKQVLLTNLLTDFPEMTIATDNVDPDAVATPHRWDIRFIRRFMLAFGLVSSVCDYLTFGVLLWGMHATPAQFRTGWFVESVVTASSIVLVIRTRKPFWRSQPSRPLLATTLAIVALVLGLPYTPLAPLFGFVALPGVFLLVLGAVLLFYIAAAELTKLWFFRPRAS